MSTPFHAPWEASMPPHRYGTAALLAVTAFRCGIGTPTTADVSFIPLDYRQYAPAGKLVSSGNPSLDCWNNINIQLAMLDRRSRDNEHQATFSRSHASAIRQRLTTGVDPELVDWARALPRLMEAGASMREEAATLRRRGLDTANVRG